MSKYWTVAASMCIIILGLVIGAAIRGNDEPTSVSSATPHSNADAETEDNAEPVRDDHRGLGDGVQTTAPAQPAPDSPAEVKNESSNVELIQSGFDGGEYFCDVGGYESSEIFDYAEPPPEPVADPDVPRDQLARALRGSVLADRLEEVLRVKTVFWRTFEPWVDTPVEMEATAMAEVLDFDIDRTLQLTGPLAERQELLMYVELLDLNRTEKQVAGLAVFDFEPNAGWLLTRIEMCESARTGGVPQPTPDTSDAYWIDAEGNVYDYDPDAVDE